jgi:hypothetical protein
MSTQRRIEHGFNLGRAIYTPRVNNVAALDFEVRNTPGHNLVSLGMSTPFQD